MTSHGPIKSSRADQFQKLSEVGKFDVAVIGGGATGVGVALDAAARGFKTVLIEAHDIGKGRGGFHFE